MQKVFQSLLANFYVLGIYILTYYTRARFARIPNGKVKSVLLYYHYPSLHDVYMN